jgi:hypothetical protein
MFLTIYSYPHLGYNSQKSEGVYDARVKKTFRST